MDEEDEMSISSKGGSDLDSDPIECVECRAQFLETDTGCSAFRELCPDCFSKDKNCIDDEADDADSKQTPIVDEEEDESADGSSKQQEEDEENGQHVEEGDDGHKNQDENCDASLKAYKQRMIDVFLSGDITNSTTVAGTDQTFVRKTFKMDKAGTPLRLFIDLELKDKCPLLYDYFMLSAHVNSKTKQFVHSWVVVKDNMGRKFIVMCVLRTKCVEPRYDAVLISCTNLTNVFRVIGTTKFFKNYVTLPDEEYEEQTALVAAMNRWFVKEGMVWDPKGDRTTKDMRGTPCPLGIFVEDMSTYSSSGKRQSNPVTYFEPDPSSTKSPQKKQRRSAPKKRGGARGKRAAAVAAAKQVSPSYLCSTGMYILLTLHPLTT